MRESFHGIWPIWKIAKKRESRLGFVLTVGAILAPFFVYFMWPQIELQLRWTMWDGTQDGIR